MKRRERRESGMKRSRTYVIFPPRPSSLIEEKPPLVGDINCLMRLFVQSIFQDVCVHVCACGVFS